jgi:hypothetical protein
VKLSIVEYPAITLFCQAIIVDSPPFHARIPRVRHSMHRLLILAIDGAHERSAAQAASRVHAIGSGVIGAWVTDWRYRRSDTPPGP